MFKESKCGLIVGRFQPIHEGHCNIIKKALSMCDKLIIVIGSMQESRTQRNPFTYEEREKFIRNIFYEEIRNDRMIVIGIPDRERPSNDSSWGVHLFNYIEEKLGCRPNIIFEGQEGERATWYDDLGEHIQVHRVSRGLIPISATKVREAIIKKDDYHYRQWMPIALWWCFDDMREILLTV